MPVEATGTWYAANASQLALGVVLLVAAYSKLRRPASFVTTVAGYRLIPMGLVRYVAWSLIVVESFLAVALLTGWLYSFALPITVVTFLLFMVVVAVTLGRGRRVRCGCFGNTDEMLSARTLVRLLMLASTAVLLLASDLAGWSQPLMMNQILRDWHGFTYGLLMMTLAAFGLLLGNWLVNLPEVVSTLRAPARPAATTTATRDEA